MKNKLNTNNTSGYKGVLWCKYHNKWKASIRESGKQVHIGYFFNLKEAIEAYDAKLIKLHGNDIITNKKLIELKVISSPTEGLDRIKNKVLDLEGENWRDIAGFEGVYQISDMGRIKSLQKIKCNGHFSEENLLKQGLDESGYKQVTLCKNCTRTSYKVHRLVAQAFIKNPNNLPQINHKNLNKQDNKVNNLEWITHLDNIRHAVQNGSFQGRCKLDVNKVKEIKLLFLNRDDNVNKTDIIKQLSIKYKVSYYTIKDMIQGKTWKLVN